MVRSITTWLDQREAEAQRLRSESYREAEAQRLRSESYREAVLNGAAEALDKAIALADQGIERLTEAQEAITAVRSQRDATLELLKRYEAERFAYRMQGYSFGFILGVLVTYGAMS